MTEIPNYYKEWDPKPEHYEGVRKYIEERKLRCKNLKPSQKKKKK